MYQHHIKQYNDWVYNVCWWTTIEVEAYTTYYCRCEACKGVKGSNGWSLCTCTSRWTLTTKTAPYLQPQAANFIRRLDHWFNEQHGRRKRAFMCLLVFTTIAAAEEGSSLVVDWEDSLPLFDDAASRATSFSDGWRCIISPSATSILSPGEHMLY